MPSLIDIRRRIRSMKNMQQITKAMKMVSAAKLRRAQERALAARPYNAILNRVLANIALAAQQNEAAAALPLLQVREERRLGVILVTSDRPLAGAFNANLLRLAQRFFDDHRDTQLGVEALGRKGRDYLRRRGFTITGEYIGVIDHPSHTQAAEIANKLIEQYANAEIDAVYLIFNEFKSVMAPNLMIQRVLPVNLAGPSRDEAGRQAAPNAEQQNPPQIDYIYEQPPEQLLAELLPRYVQMQIYRAMLESISAEHAARMTAMDAASSNASELIDKLTLNMNRVRQAAITREIIEIVSGAAAM